MPLCPGGGSREKETREAPWLLVSRWLRISRGRELEECVPAMLRKVRCCLKPFGEGLSFPGLPGTIPLWARETAPS